MAKFFSVFFSAPVSAFGVLAVAVSILIWGPVVILVAMTGNRRLTSWSIRVWNRSTLFWFGIRVKVEGLENYDATRSCLIVSNHQSNLDIPALYTALNGDVRMVAKAELFKIPVFGPALKACEFIPIERDKQGAGQTVSSKIRDHIRSGLQMWVSPEGTRSPDGRVGSFKRGSFAIAIGAQVPVQPIAILDAYKALPKDGFLPRLGATVHLRLLPPIPTLGMDANDRGALAERCRELIALNVEKGPSA